ncbi:YybS family protein [Alkalibacillus haloalkaliphilus]|uniref:YybS family protein n=1 Tax=Alkalibacillus haloalkaliphilus TaxID=94136 RepID=UPI00031D76DA|nr:YybS family protein [Alkalibacillus haloalkaliphilus]
MEDRNIVKQGAIAGAVFILLMIATFFVPIISLVSIFLLPIPLIVFGSRFGFKPVAILFLIVSLISILLLSIYSLPIVFVMGLGGLAIGAAIYSKKDAYETWAQGTFSFAIGMAVVYAITQFMFDINWVHELNALIEESLESTVAFAEQVGTPITQEEYEALQQSLSELTYLIPTGMVLIGLALAFISQWISYKFINRSGGARLKFPPFKDFKLPTSIIWIFLLGIILTWVYTDPAETMYLAAANLYALPGLLLVIQGLSFVFFYTHYKSWSKAIPIFTVILFVLFPFLLIYPLRILGIIDLGFRLRERLNGSK